MNFEQFLLLMRRRASLISRKTFMCVCADRRALYVNILQLQAFFEESWSGGCCLHPYVALDKFDIGTWENLKCVGFLVTHPDQIGVRFVYCLLCCHLEVWLDVSASASHVVHGTRPNLQWQRVLPCMRVNVGTDVPLPRGRWIIYDQCESTSRFDLYSVEVHF